jgi:hypothetical protein
MDDTKELEDLNYEKSKQHMGGVVFVSILMIFLTWPRKNVSNNNYLSTAITDNINEDDKQMK